MYYLHYPTGGFGHYMSQMLSICFDNVYCPQEESSFSVSGNSHGYPLHYRKWWLDRPWEIEPKFDFGDKESICLIDSGIDDDEYKNTPNTIRMVIDRPSRSIIYQTLTNKVLKEFFKIDREKNFTGEDWELREYYSLVYHHADAVPNFSLNKFQPHPKCINIALSDLFFNMDNVLEILTKCFGKYDREKLTNLHNKFLEANASYTLACRTEKELVHCLQTEKNMSLEHITSLHDQGYLNYVMERMYNINEIPPYDYKDWFRNTQEIRTCLKSILSQ